MTPTPNFRGRFNFYALYRKSTLYIVMENHTSIDHVSIKKTIVFLASIFLVTKLSWALSILASQGWIVLSTADSVDEWYLVNMLTNSFGQGKGARALSLLFSVFVIILVSQYSREVFGNRFWISKREANFLIHLFGGGIIIYCLTGLLLGYIWKSEAILLVGFFLTVVGSPVVEELIFRGFLYKQLLQRFQRRLGVLASFAIGSVLFSVFHDFDTTWHGFIFLFLLSMILYYVRHIKNTILLPIVVHAFVNFGAYLGSSSSARSAINGVFGFE